ncbi:MAG: type II toxin-antitoxin system VapB family antitoxin [Thermoanaerobaculia bacterium]|nr:type II toxin-antitoxin system VapB family antitoxin [Thermoanaerobaculia bacterium]
MKRTSLEIDEEKLARARRVLGTTGIKDTVDRALAEVIRAELRSRLAERISSGEGIDRGEEILDESRRWER